ncbi:MAG: hydrogenase maturation protease [bacterium]
MKLNDIISSLRASVSPDSVVMIGLGNRDRSDDGFGLELARRLKERFAERIFSEDEKSVEGIVLELIEREDVQTFLFVDATDFSGGPGEVRLFTDNDGEQFVPSFSTHKVPISLLIEIIRQHGKKFLLLGVQPESTQLFGGFSRSILDVMDRLEEEFVQFFNEKIRDV